MEREESTTVVRDGLRDGDTLGRDLPVGSKVRCSLGDRKGVSGAMAALRTAGQVLVRISQGVYIEVPRFCLEELGPEVTK